MSILKKRLKKNKYIYHIIKKYIKIIKYDDTDESKDILMRK